MIQRISADSGNENGLHDLAFQQDNVHLFGSDSSTIHVWNAESGIEMLRQSLGNDVAAKMTLSPDGRTLVTGHGVARDGKPNEFNAYVWRLPESAWPAAKRERR